MIRSILQIWFHVMKDFLFLSHSCENNTFLIQLIEFFLLMILIGSGFTVKLQKCMRQVISEQIF